MLNNKDLVSLPLDLRIAYDSDLQLFDYNTAISNYKIKVDLHKHTFSFLLQGSKEIITNNKKVHIQEDQFLIIKSGKCLMSEHISSLDKSFHSILFFFTHKMLLDYIHENELKITTDLTSDPFITFKYDDYLKQYVQSLQLLLQSRRLINPKILKIKFQEIITYLIQRGGQQFLKQLLATQESSYIRLSQIVEKNKYSKLTLSELAFLANMSLSTFKREFNKQYHVTPIKWFRERRLEHAAFLLKTTNKRPSDIYMDAGYENFSNFVKAFKNKFNLTPKQFQVAQKRV